MKLKRAAGVLLHPTSLPGPDGIGDLGPQAYRWIDFLVEAGCGLWQVLPLGPTGYGDSPYQCFSAFAGNPFLISPELLLQDGLLTEADVADRPDFPVDRVDYGPVITWKLTLLDRAFANFKANASNQLRDEFTAFRSREAAWLNDFAAFMAMKEANGGVAWKDWPDPQRRREPHALSAAYQSEAFSATPSASSYSSGNGGRCGSIPMSAASRSSATFRSSWRMTAPTRGRIPNSSTWTSRACRPWWPVCRPITFRRRGSCGAIHCIAGACINNRGTHGGSSESARRCARSI